MRATDPVILARRADEVSVILKQLANPVRLRVICALLEGDKSVGELVAVAGSSQPWVSQFLARMRSDGLVEANKQGQFVRYRIADPRIRDLMRAIQRVYCPPSKGGSA